LPRAPDAQTKNYGEPDAPTTTRIRQQAGSPNLNSVLVIAIWVNLPFLSLHRPFGAAITDKTAFAPASQYSVRREFVLIWQYSPVNQVKNEKNEEKELSPPSRSQHCRNQYSASMDYPLPSQ
jgi:hypothetical protein